ncbi:MAG: PDZ domain-containing protein [Phaeodactylibacter sp.]|nr:PDZ domain-containing protein [Phaeodactylibacter sp.]MCB9293894.1 PDZ domain-containing protein [Lewinellaceae bacterium]
MKNFTLFLAGALALLFLMPNAGLQAQAAEKNGEVVIIQEVKHEDGSVSTVKKRIQKGEDIQTIVKQFNAEGGKDVKVHILSDGEKTDVTSNEEEETVFYFRRAKEHSQEMEELAEEMKELEKELESMHIVIHGDEFNFENFEWDQEEPRSERLRSERATKAFLGVYPDNTEDGVGVRLDGIVSNSGAAAAGLQQGDIITSIGGHATNGTYGLRGALSKLEPGETVPVAYRRDGQALQAQVTLGAKEYTRHVLNEKRDPCNVFIGVYVGGRAHTGSGVQITGIIGNTPAADDGVEAGDIILAMDDVPVNNNSELLTERNKHKPGEAFKLTIQRGDQQITVNSRFKTCETTGMEEPVVEEVLAEEPVEEAQPAVQFPETTLELKDYKAYPNPSFGEVTVQFQAEAVPTEIQLSDSSGRVFFQRKIRNFDGYFNEELSLREATPGTITLSIRQGDKLITRQLVLLNRA